MIFMGNLEGGYTMGNELDPIKYEVFVGRLRTTLEEGRQAIAMVSGSPAIVEGGEFMTSIYDGDGKGILTAAGTLFHVMGSGDSIKHAIREYEENPGINDGDQFFYNDPYIAGTHVMDQIIVKPIFYQGRRVAWVGTMTHTGDVGGILRGASTEIFHEGLRIRGLKIVEGGRVRKDILQSITEQCRDPDYVALDQLARIAANNVCAEGYMRLVEKFGIDFVEAACRKLIQDAERMFREKLRSLPDGTWRQRVYISRTRRVDKKEEMVPLEAVCSVTKRGDQIFFDATGSSPQVEDYCNAALPASRSCLFSALAATFIWDIPWNSELMEWVSYTIPEGTFINCRFPASCGLGTMAGITLLTAVAGCIAKMVYAAGKHEFVNASWGALGGSSANFGPGNWWGGHSQHGGVVGQGTYDLFGSGLGATPYRDGVDTGGNYVNARSAISDVEWTEMYFPFLTLARRQGIDSGGYGKYRGGLNLEVIQMVYGSKDLTTDYLPGPEGGEVRGFGLFGGYPVGNILGDSVLLLTSEGELRERLSEGVYPVTSEELAAWGTNAKKSPGFSIERQLGGIRVNAPEYSLIGFVYGCGGGYGDPLDRDPLKVQQDVRNEAVSLETAAKVYGVVIHPETLEVDPDRTERRRQEIRQERLAKGERLSPGEDPTKVRPPTKKRSLLRIHEYLEIIERSDGAKTICCIKCGYEFCSAGDNYKKHALRWTRDLREMKKMAEGEEPISSYQEYICPGCGTLLQVDVWCPRIDSDEPLWDIQMDAEALG
jgi:N-methylhydantoinase B